MAASMDASMAVGLPAFDQHTNNSECPDCRPPSIAAQTLLTEIAIMATLQEQVMKNVLVQFGEFVSDIFVLVREYEKIFSVCQRIKESVPLVLTLILLGSGFINKQKNLSQ